VIPLEKLSTPRFEGDPKQYTSFSNLFDTVVHENPNLRPVIKFSYLKAYLEDELLTIISNLIISNAKHFGQTQYQLLYNWTESFEPTLDDVKSNVR